ncbi:RUN domain-containing protein 1 [Sabethes cyaneus]|uniref:RUN domain-containing protein 1 n=1 Tax=Sabethes cyaneus TaxID=53552 RepID=UPI00237E277A|nr:RUN domain-containing protein 1 [Sabethes cyaneus]XP_053689673.1 RUN domain-containing protein 1 [Sabethes cyaneus]XP_053689684.1 RUN domain-containing protein 1 [Sabethes cyaneus]
MSIEVEINQCDVLQSDTFDEYDEKTKAVDRNKLLFAENEQLLRAAVSDDDFDFDSAFSSESNNLLTDESTEPGGQYGGSTAGGGVLENDRLQSLEDEHETLSSNLMALTSHFAQVQLRLRQIVDAPQEERDYLLKNLEEFAFLGIPELQQNAARKNIPEIVAKLDNSPESVESLREKQAALIEQLKNQLIDLERYAYESGTGILPHTILLEKQKVIIDEIKNKINLNLNELDLPQLTTEDLRTQVDSALDEQLVNPLKMKEQLVSQLKTQIQDLERFISFLQTNEKEEIKKRFLQQQELAKAEAAERAEYREKAKSRSLPSRQEQTRSERCPEDTHQSFSRKESFNSKAFGLMDKASTILQMFALSQFNCGSERNQENFQRNIMKRSKENCWGDMRAKLEVDVQEVVSLAMEAQEDLQLSDIASECGDLQVANSRKKYELTMFVRKHLAKTIQGLMQHGLRGTSESSVSIVPFISGCFSGESYQQQTQASTSDDHFYGGNAKKRNSDNASKTATSAPRRHSEFSHGEELPEQNVFSQIEEEEENGEITYYSGDEAEMHAWELLLLYYNIKNGDRYNSTPARKLSESFNLDLVDGRPQSNKQSLLSTIGTIVSLHSPYKRSYNSQFKAFICAALNAQKLTQWLHLVYQCKDLINSYYSSWSYVANTGFRDAMKTLDRLTQYRFDLPVDLSVRQFKNIKDVFI